MIYLPTQSGRHERLRACKSGINLLKRSSHFSSRFYGYTRTLCLPMGQGSTGGRNCTVFVGVDLSDVAASMDSHLYDVFGIRLGT